MGETLAGDEAAWREAVRLFSRDVEHALRPGDSWTLGVYDGREPVDARRIAHAMREAT
jgi:hypothetical protein